MSRSSSLRFGIGLLAGLAAALSLGEIYSRRFPPADLQPFLGNASALTGIYRSDPKTGVAYRSLEDFRTEYRSRLTELEEPDQPARTWLWFGSSFVQAPGMLGDLAQAEKPDVRMFYLKRNVELPVRVAQLRLLLDNGLKPERVIFVLIPMDVVSLARRPLHMMTVHSGGAITYHWRLPAAPVRSIVSHSRLALLGWLRSGGDRANPTWQPAQVTEVLPESLRQDLTAIFNVLGELSRKHDVPITVVLLPNREQIFGQSGFALQDFEGDRCRAAGIDCYNTRDLFTAEPAKMLLFVSDWHFSDKGNRLILDGLYSHWQQSRNNKTQP